MQKYESLTSEHYTTIQSTWKVANDGHVYIKIKKVMYGLKQAAVLAYKNIVQNIVHYGYIPWKYSTSLCWHTKKRKKISALFILVSIDFPILTLIISWTLLKHITKYPWTFKGRTTLDWPLTVITKRKRYTYPCLLTSPKTSNIFSVLPPKIHDMNPTNGQFHHMSEALSMQNYQTTSHLLIKKSPNTYKPRLVHYFTTREQLIQTCCLP